MTAHAAVHVTLPAGTTLGEREDFIEKARELGACFVGMRPSDMLLSWEAPDLWLLFSLVRDAFSDLSDYFHDYGQTLDDLLNNAAVANGLDADNAVLHYWVAS